MAYKIIVIVRETWDTRDGGSELIDEEGRLRNASLAARFEPEDLNALEMALQIKDLHGGSVTALAMSPRSDLEVLRECLYRGTDAVINLHADHLSEYDTASAARFYAAAIRKIGDFDLLFSAVSLTTGENALIGPGIAALLGIEHFSYIDAIEGIDERHISLRRSVEMGYEIIEAPFPVMISAGVALLQDDPRAPRSAKATLKLKLKKAPILQWGPMDLNMDNPIAHKNVDTISYAFLPSKAVHSRQVDPNSATELTAMLHDVLKGI